MPLISSTYNSILPFGHLETILPNLLRKVTFISPVLERIDTPDDDFLDLEWYKQPNKDKLVILTHGLEGNAKRTYMLGMAKKFYTNGYSVLCWNFRSCSAEMNRQLRFYHTGDTTDLKTIIDYVISHYSYKKIALVGFSMGGNITLKYLGELATSIPSAIQVACAISAPVHLASSSRRMMTFENKIYMNRFIRFLRKKIETKTLLYPDKLSLVGYEKIKNFKDFDDKYTAPIHGFDSAEDYWEKASSLPYLSHIKIPTLLLNAANDSFLGPECYPIDIAQKSKNFYLEIPKGGGHVGFWTTKKEYWDEKRVFQFCEELIDA